MPDAARIGRPREGSADRLDAALDRYAARLGFVRPLTPDLRTLGDLHAAHMAAVPFENSSVLFGEPIALDPASFVDKVAVHGRGGFCYELNGAFAALLGDAGYAVEYLEARVYGDGGRLGEPFEHLALRVTLDGPWLVDVGFGYSFARPLRLDDPGEQADAMGAFRLVPADDGLDLEWQHRDGRWVPHYRVTLEARPLEAFGPMCAQLQSDPGSPFVQDWLCSRIEGAGGVTLFGRRFIDTRGPTRVEADLTDDEVPGRLATHFGVQARLAGDRWRPADDA